MTPPASPTLSPEAIRARIAEKLGPRPALKHTPCVACEGLGVIYDAADVGRRVGAWRVALGLTKEAVAQQLGVTRVYFHNLEAGERTWHTSRILEVIVILNAEETAQAAGKPRPAKRSRRAAIKPKSPPRPLSPFEPACPGNCPGPKPRRR